MEKLLCPVCGEPTRVYMGKARKDKLCGKHADDLKNGLLIQCESCNGFHYRTQSCKKKSKDNKFIGKCIVCHQLSPNGSLCRDCYYDMLDFKDTFNKNSKSFELKDHYFNLRSSIYRMKNLDYVHSNCNKLMALALLVKDLFHDESLSDRVDNDIIDIIDKKTIKEDSPKSEYSILQDSHKEETHRTADGHYVKSHPESVIDDILYNLRIVHCYEKKVPIPADVRTVMCDWFIPVNSNMEGIYVEYWGMRKKEYELNKDEKRKLYKEYDIPLIELEKDDYIDVQRLMDIFVVEINRLAKKYYGRKNFI